MKIQISLIILLISSILSSNNIVYKGVTFVGDRYCPNVTFSDPEAVESLENIKKTGANYIALVVTEYQDYTYSTEIGPEYENPRESEYYVYKTERIEGIVTIIKEAHRLGLKVMMKPHIDLKMEEHYESVWRGDICMKSEEDWAKWFESYTKMIVKYAKLSEELKVEMFSISCELVKTNSRDQQWREVVKKVREVYHGLITDSANHDGEEMTKSWWDVIDVIGVDAYYLPIQSPLLKDIELDVDRRINSIVQTLERLSSKYGEKDIIITEIGFCSGNCKIKDRSWTPDLSDHYIQAYFYERFMNVLSQEKFIKGFFWWSWNTDPNTGGLKDHCITPQHKMSEYVLYKYYGGRLENLQFEPKGNPKCLCTI